MRSFRGRAGAVACAVALSMPLVTGCGSDTSVVSAADATPTVTPSATPTPSASASLSRERAERQALVRSAKIGWEEAAKKATAEVPQSELAELDLERAPRSSSPSGGTSGTASASATSAASASPGPRGPQWKATVALRDGTAHIVTIDAVTGKVLGERLEEDQDTGDKQELARLLTEATQTPQQAAEAATKKFPGTVTGLQLSEDDNAGSSSSSSSSSGNKPVAVWEAEVANTDDWTEADITVDAASGKVLEERIDRD
ncbi:PepSY domain-containing protein [Streptomyces yaizuensis]|uniref:PepSY domain-containing protein n=1 Tax=Streptomyces yaizuensis TaxID=2989713 RepID=A0ABQ5PAI6_9ACTN|nr:PepSY domain-containing protein [Streptomyces sp. YSPA8]GLF99595.1 PepSY domain-containing protein [Streptomyces sp. YSPA8]